MPPKPWIKIGSHRVLANIYSKELISQKYINPANGNEVDWGLFHATKTTVMIVPIVGHDKIVVIRQFRHAINQVIWELPAGVIDGNESPEDTAKRELLEETGYKAGRTILMRPETNLWYDPPSFALSHYACLALNCTKADQGQRLDENETIEVNIVDLQEWVIMCQSGAVVSDPMIATTFSALPFLGIKFQFTQDGEQYIQK